MTSALFLASIVGIIGYMTLTRGGLETVQAQSDAEM